ncbi:MAG: type II toxin-antitoxin system HipA family toxin [Gemmatimonadaceae bacterium]|nr:type II toxin-antitoxin system HipA family toxin [Gemmatimonadaceae bacterium]
MLYAPASESDRKALTKAVERRALRQIARGVYTDERDQLLDQIVQSHLPAILSLAYPGWHISHSTAALLRSVNGSAFISGTAQTRQPAKLPGIVVHRLSALPYPDIVELGLDEMVAPSLSAEPGPVRVRLSSPLQTVFELLDSDARQPDRTLPPETIRSLIDALTESDRLRAASFAERNGLLAELARFNAIRAGLEDTRAVQVMRPEGLDLFFYNWRVGRLEALPGREYRFTYDDGWTIPITGLRLGSDGPAYEGLGLPAFFDNMLPEGWAEARLQAVHKIARTDAFAMLRTTQKYLSNLTLRPSGFDESRLVLDHLDVRLADIAATTDPLPVEEQIGADPDSRDLWLELRRRGATRLSGIQPKLPVHLKLAGTHTRLTIGHAGNTSTHILKLPSPEFPQLVENEWATMELARRVGLPVAPVRRVEFPADSQLRGPGLLVERFDLPASLSSPRRVLLLEEAASLLGIRREEKYSVSMERIGAALLAAGVAGSDLNLFFDHVVFSWIVGNGDLHAKNIAVLRSIEPGTLGDPPRQAETRYSPLYDLVNTRLVIAGDLFALPLNGKQNNLRVNDFAVLARGWGWTKAQARERVEDLASKISARLADTLASSGLSEESRQRYRATIDGTIGGL